MRRIAPFLAISVTGGLGIALLLAGCGTIMHGSTQAVGIGSTPTGATVTVDNASLGKTPVIATLSRKDQHIVKIELDGYLPFESTITRSVSGWVWGNIVFGGLIGLAVDAISGGLYKLTPEQVQATMAQNVSFSRDGDRLIIAVVLAPEAGWEQIGQLFPSVP